MLTPEEQNEIMRQDRRRRRQREQQEMIELHMKANYPTEDFAKGFKHANRELVRGIGVVSPPHVAKASKSSWERGLKCSTTVGVAPGANPNNGASMKITYADGTQEIAPL